MTGYRYIVMYDEEYQGIGMFHGLDEIDMGEDGIKGLLWLFHDLTIPSHEIFIDNRNAVSFFTKEGLQKYKDAINEVNNAYLQCSIYHLKMITCDIPDNAILYKDDDQLITKPFKEYTDLIKEMDFTITICDLENIIDELPNETLDEANEERE